MNIIIPIWAINLIFLCSYFLGYLIAKMIYNKELKEANND